MKKSPSVLKFEMGKEFGNLEKHAGKGSFFMTFIQACIHLPLETAENIENLKKNSIEKHKYLSLKIFVNLLLLVYLLAL